MRNLLTKCMFVIAIPAMVMMYSCKCNDDHTPDGSGGENGEVNRNGSTGNSQTSDPDNNYNHTIPQGAGTNTTGGTGTTNGSTSGSGTGADSTGRNPAYNNRSGSTTVNNTTISTTGNGTTGSTSGTTTGTSGTTQGTTSGSTTH